MYFVIYVLIIVSTLMAIYVLHEKGFISHRIYRHIKTGFFISSGIISAVLGLFGMAMLIGFVGSWLISISPWLLLPAIFFGFAAFTAFIEWITG